ncbi:hypothetical protein LCGC14_2578700, partial [marine sediment metagenome]
PWNIVPWSPGGLATGAPVELVQTLSAIAAAAGGNKSALDRALVGIKRSLTLYLPFYEQTIDAIDSVTGYNDIDLLGMRSLREAMSDKYEVDVDRAKRERDFVELVQHLFFGSDKAKE